MNSKILLMSLAVLLLLTILFSHKTLDQIFTDILFKYTTPLPHSGKIVLVTLSDLDIDALGGWPITRDYYAYFIHAAASMGAGVIGMDLLLDQPNTHNREHDDALALMIQTAGNVCLPFVYQETDAEEGHKPLMPATQFSEHLLGTGFSNLGETGTIRAVPIFMIEEDTLRFSFGAEMVRQYLRLTENEANVPDFVRDANSYTINFRTQIADFETYTFVNLLRAFEANPDSLDLTGKLVILAPIAQTLPVIKKTPVQKMPGTFIHALVADNLISGNQLRILPVWIFWILGLVLSAGLIKLNLKQRSLVSVLFLIFYAITVYIFFQMNVILSFAIPVMSCIGFWGMTLIWKWIQQKSALSESNQLLKAEIAATNEKLQEKETELDVYISTHTEMDTQLHVLIQERETLEKHLNDLKIMTQPNVDMGHLDFPEIIHDPASPLKQVLDQIPAVAEDNIPVLIHGQTGTGKELIAKAVHQSSKRKNRPFLAVNCGALSENLLESELFGHEKGSFTGAHARRKGRFEQADQGTLFLDEIAETTPAFQAKLLRVLQEGTFERVGGEASIRVDVRIITATNKDLQQWSEKGNFRADLFYRLNGFPIRLPALHERPMDILLLASHFLLRHGFKNMRISKEAMNRLQQYAWPGNVRELENLIRRAALITQSKGKKIIQVKDLPEEVMRKSNAGSALNYKPLEEQVLETLRLFKFSRSAINETARVLGNKDRGTITEYFRGSCFLTLQQNGFDLEKTIAEIADTEDKNVLQKVSNKLNTYLESLPQIDPELSLEQAVSTLPCFKGLPQKFHPALYALLRHRSGLEPV